MEDTLHEVGETLQGRGLLVRILVAIMDALNAGKVPS
jgi:hypothetical protein